jgi:dipeptidyl-peptidase-3
MKIITGCLGLAALALLTPGAAPAQTNVVVDRVGDTGFVALQAESFRTLSSRQQELAYWLTQAAIAIDPIFYDQLSASGLRQKRLLEEIMAHRLAVDPAVRPGLEAYTKLFWANRGNHNLFTSHKFIPTISADDLRRAARAAQQAGAFRTACADLPPLATPAALDAEVTALQPAIFDPQFEPMITAKSGHDGLDIIQSSATTFYGPGVTLADLKNFHGQHPLNSRVVKDADGKLREIVYRAGTPDGKFAPGLYAVFLNRAIADLTQAQAAAEPAQAAAIGHLIRFFQTGEYADLLTADSAWVQDNPTVDFLNGFVEIYRDANGTKASAQSFVSITDGPLTRTMSKLAENAAYFEAKAPWAAAYKKKDFQPPLVKAVEVLIETGDFHVITIGDNLPNENEIHEKYGSKNFLFTASSRALKAAAGQKSNAEFYPDPEVLARQAAHGDAADELLTALHEVIGHGSGKLSDRLRGGAASYLKEYFSTLEEARADLMALWNVWDPKLAELGLVSNQEEEAKAMYDRAALTVLVQLRSIPKGNTIEEDHQRNRALIANYVMDRTGAIEFFMRAGKTYVRVVDYQKMRAGVGELLAELMRIKAEGDYAAIQALVEKYGAHFDPALRDQVLARYRQLDLPTYWAGINPELSAEMDPAGKLIRVNLTYPTDPIHQYVRYGSMYDAGLSQPGNL